MITTAPSSPPAVPLPTPEERPEADIVIFDGQCSFCRAQVERFARWDRRRQLAFLSLHDPQVYQRFPHLNSDDLMREMVIVDRWGNNHAGAAAIRYLSRRLRRLWPLVPILHLPGTMPVWRWFYRLVAGRRYGLGGSTKCTNGSCRLDR